MDEKQRGAYRKFEVKRTDGRDAPGEKHEDCRLFVLDLEHDSHARSALLTYAGSCGEDYPALAADIRRMLFAKCGEDERPEEDAPAEGSEMAAVSANARAERAEHENERLRGNKMTLIEEALELVAALEAERDSIRDELEAADCRVVDLVQRSAALVADRDELHKFKRGFDAWAAAAADGFQSTNRRGVREAVQKTMAALASIDARDAMEDA